MSKQDLEKQLSFLNDDYRKVTGKSFTNFFCPLLLKDEQTELCLGHIVNDAIPNSSRCRVVQRRDVDNFYGEFAEREFTTHAQTRSFRVDELVTNLEMSKKLRPKVSIDGVPVAHYLNKGVAAPGHTPFRFTDSSGTSIILILKSGPEIFGGKDKGEFEVTLGTDCRLHALVALIKSGYLTLFRLLGYGYALSPEGMNVGDRILGAFFHKSGHKKRQDVVADAADFFLPFVNMMRPLERFDGPGFQGTVEDGRGQVCVTDDGSIFGIIVWVRTNTNFSAVLLPYYRSEEGKRAFNDFMVNDVDLLKVRHCLIENASIKVSQRLSTVTWAKRNPSFGFANYERN